MKFKFLKPLVINTLVALVVGALFVLGGCSDDDGPAPIPDPTESIIQIVNGDPELSDLAAYLEQFPDLTALLSGTSPYTFFAPNNAAFTSLYATPGFPEDPADISIDVIKGVIAYHIVASQLLSTDLTPTGSGAGLATLYDDTDPCTGAKENQVIKVNDDGTLKTGSTTTNIEIGEADILATNGVVHVTKSVLIPPSVGAGLTPILGKLVANILLGGDFSTMAKVMTKADCGITNPDTTPLSNILANPDGTYTLFLVPNTVFAGTAAASGGITVDQLIAAYTAAEWRSILLNHILAATKSGDELVDGNSYTSLLDPGVSLIGAADGAPGDPTTDPTKSPIGKYLSTSGGTTGINGGVGTSGAPIYVKDIAASNGVAHVIGKILFPN